VHLNRSAPHPSAGMGGRILAALLLVLLLSAMGVPPVLLAQEPSETAGAPLQLPGTPALTPTIFLQFLADHEGDRSYPGENGFSLPAVWMGFRGQLPGGVSYLVQLNRGSLLDARISLRLAPGVSVDAGQFKVPFSAEFLTSTSRSDMVLPYQALQALGPGRQVGLQLRWEGAAWGLFGGLFNGDGMAATGNQDGEFLGLVRGEVEPRVQPGDTLRFGVSAARSGGVESISGDGLGFRVGNPRTLLGVDGRWALANWFATAEWIAADLATAPPADPWGGQVTLGYRRGVNRARLRWDHFDPGVVGQTPSTLLILGVDRDPTPETRAMLDVALPMDGPARGARVLFRTQIAF